MTKHFLFAFVVCAIFAATASAQLTTITQSSDNTTVVAGSVACAQGGGAVTVQNDYWRDYNTTTQGLFAPIFLWGADIGVEVVNTAASGNGSHACTLTIYSDPTPGDITANIADLVVLASETFFVADTALTVEQLRFTQPFPAFTPNGVDNLVCQLDTPAAGDQFFFGSNMSGQTAPSYLSSAACGINLPSDTNGFVPGGMMLIFDIVFDPMTNVPALGRPGTGEDLNLLTGVAGAVPDQVDMKTASSTANDTLQVDLISPNGGFAASTYIVLATLNIGAQMYVDVAGGFGPIYLPVPGGGAIFDISGGGTAVPGFGFRPILAAGYSGTFILPTGFAGTELGLQGIADTGGISNNLVYASTRHHIIGLL